MGPNKPCECGSGKKSKKCCARPLQTPKREPVQRHRGGSSMAFFAMSMFAGMATQGYHEVNGRSKSNKRR